MTLAVNLGLGLVALAIFLLASLGLLYSALGIPFPMAVVLAAGALGVTAAALAMARGMRPTNRMERLLRDATAAAPGAAASGSAVSRPSIEAAVLAFD